MSKTTKSKSATHAAVIYLRVSTAQQATDGNGIEVQRASCLATAERLGLEVVGECVDSAVSGTTDALDREGFNCLVERLLAREADTVICHHGDRLARSLHVQEAALAVLWQHGASVYLGGELVLADDPADPMRTMVRQILGAVNEYARRDVMLKMHGGRKAVRRTQPGRYIGGATVPAGCRVVDGRIEASPEMLAQLDTIRAAMVAGSSRWAIGQSLGLTAQQVQRRLDTAARLGL